MSSVCVLGADPEVFLIDMKLQKVISSVGLIGGSKDYPLPIGEGCAVQEDNVTVEFNTPPCKSADDYVRSINYNLAHIRARAAELGLDVLIKPSSIMDDDQLQTEGAQTFGCEPDFNAWKDGEMNPKPKADNPNLRSAGGHIHVSVPEGMDGIAVIKALDWFVGCQMLLIDKDTDRRKLYGNAGAFRWKPYGVEYRTPSNAWIASDELIRWAWGQVEKALAWVAAGNSFTDEQGSLIQECINNSDMAAYEQLCTEFSV